jgi:hypothetical protein
LTQADDREPRLLVKATGVTQDFEDRPILLKSQRIERMFGLLRADRSADGTDNHTHARDHVRCT